MCSSSLVNKGKFSFITRREQGRATWATKSAKLPLLISGLLSYRAIKKSMLINTQLIKIDKWRTETFLKGILFNTVFGHSWKIKHKETPGPCNCYNSLEDQAACLMITKSLGITSFLVQKISSIHISEKILPAWRWKVTFLVFFINSCYLYRNKTDKSIWDGICSLCLSPSFIGDWEDDYFETPANTCPAASSLFYLPKARKALMLENIHACEYWNSVPAMAHHSSGAMS